MGLVVTRIRSGLPFSTFEQSAWARSSARHAEASLLASSRTSPSADAQAARAQPIVPLPTTAGRLYPSEPVNHGGYYHAPGGIGLVALRGTLLTWRSPRGDTVRRRPPAGWLPPS